MGRDENLKEHSACTPLGRGRRREWMRVAGRIAFLATLALVVPACGDHARSEATQLVGDGFAPYPNSHWQAPVQTGNATATQALGVGDPQPSLGIGTGTTPGAGSASVTSAASWATPVTISIEEAMIGIAGDPGIGTINILNGATPVASVVWDNGANTLTFSINGVVGVSPPAPKGPPPPDGTFHFFQFSVDKNGNAAWVYGLPNASTPGAQKVVQTFAGFPMGGMLSIQVMGTFGAPGADGTLPTVYFDNLIVTVPP